jgi:hydroxyacyl-ACP dehydratase HTD2-like protein with hotdog domain
MVRPLRSGRISEAGIRKFRAAVDHWPATGDGDPSDCERVAPLLFPAAATRPVPPQARLLTDGQYDDLAPPGLAHLQSMLAGQSWEFIRPVIAGETVTEEVRISSVEERQGRNGTLIFVAEESLISDASGAAVLRGTNNLIFREPMPAQPVPDVQISETTAAGRVTEIEGDELIKRPDMVSLFMFAAVTWAVHRVHYDSSYARSEGLPGAILPGWMLSAYLCELAERIEPAHPLRKLDVRYQAMAFPGDALTCRRSAADGDEATLTIGNQNDVTIATAKAVFG